MPVRAVRAAGCAVAGKNDKESGGATRRFSWAGSIHKEGELHMRHKLTLLAATLLASPAFGAVHTTTIDAATYAGSTGTITFNDWGYTGPTGVGANDFQVGAGFDASQVGQVQKVVTKDPDYLTPDPGHNVLGDMGGGSFPNGNMDGTVNFYQWAYTTGAGSTFSAMQIDKAGNYYIAKNDMSFKTYDMYYYRDTTGTNPNAAYDTKINFKPYTVSDAGGWCGSVLGTGPAALEKMAGQVTFDIAFDVYFDLGAFPSYSSTELIPDFVMRSYGSYDVSVSTSGGDLQHYSGSAVVNNTNPLTGEVDPAYASQVSFLGGSVIPRSVWVSADSYNADGSKKMRADVNPTTGQTEMVWDVTIVEAGTPGAKEHINAYAGFAFMLRADGTRVLQQVGGEAYDPSVDYSLDRAAWTNYAAPVPEAETWAMMLAGLGLVGAMTARRRRRIGAA